MTMRAEISLSDLEDAQKLAGCISPEITDDLSRTNVSMDVEGDSLKIKIDAEDVSSLRAALNSYLRWLRIAMETNDVIGEFDDE